jgi:Leucine-rich repeat (LRR) protein
MALRDGRWKISVTMIVLVLSMLYPEGYTPPLRLKEACMNPDSVRSLSISPKEIASFVKIQNQFQYLKTIQIFRGDTSWHDIPEDFCETIRIDTLEIYHPFERLPGNFEKLTGMKKLWLNGEQLRDVNTVLNQIARIDSLSCLVIYWAPITALPELFKSLNHLAHLAFQNIKVKNPDSLVNSLKYCTGLKTIRFESMDFESKNGSSILSQHIDTIEFFNCKFDSFPTWFTKGSVMRFNRSSIKKFPASLSGFTNLTSLHLVNCGIHRFPPSFTTIPNIRDLNIDSNAIPVLPPCIGNSKTLEALSVKGNGLVYIDSAIGGLQKLMVLEVSANYLDSIPARIGKLKYLERLFVGYNKLMELPREISGCGTLKELSAPSNKIKKLPQGIENCANLAFLDISCNPLEELPANIGRLHNLNYLSASQTQLTGVPASLTDLRECEHLDLSCCLIREIPSFHTTSKYKFINVSSNGIIRLPDSISLLPELEVLKCQYNHICDITVFPDGFPKLYEIDISNNNLDHIPFSIGSFRKLHRLGISNNHLTNLPNSLGNLDSLESIDAYDNRIDSFQCDIGQFKRLTWLTLDNNNILKVPETLLQDTIARKIRLSGNPIRTIPPTVFQKCERNGSWVMANDTRLDDYSALLLNQYLFNDCINKVFSRQPCNPKDSLMVKSREFFLKKTYAEGEKYFTEAMKKYPDNRCLAEGNILCCLYQRKFSKALSINNDLLFKDSCDVGYQHRFVWLSWLLGYKKQAFLYARSIKDRCSINKRYYDDWYLGMFNKMVRELPEIEMRKLLGMTLVPKKHSDKDVIDEICRLNDLTPEGSEWIFKTSFNESGRITELEVNLYGGYLPESIKYLSALESLTIQDGSTMLMLKNMSELTSLKRLTIFVRKHDAVSPAYFTSTRLKELTVFAYDKCYATIGDLSAMKNLEKLTIQYVTMHEFPRSILTLSNLKELTLASCGIAKIPDSIFFLKKLIKINLPNNVIISIPPAITGCPSLESLCLSNNRIIEIPEGFANNPVLKEINVEGNNGITIPAAFKLKNIKVSVSSDTGDGGKNELPPGKQGE